MHLGKEQKVQVTRVNFKTNTYRAIDAVQPLNPNNLICNSPFELKYILHYVQLEIILCSIKITCSGKRIKNVEVTKY